VRREHLSILLHSSDREDLTGIYLVGDSVYIWVDVKGAIIAAVMKLMASYYVFNVDYPRHYSMLMGLFQIHVMEEPYRREKTKKFNFFNQKKQNALRSLPDPK
jgi:hypothetical protein